MDRSNMSTQQLKRLISKWPVPVPTNQSLATSSRHTTCDKCDSLTTREIIKSKSVNPVSSFKSSSKIAGGKIVKVKSKVKKVKKNLKTKVMQISKNNIRNQFSGHNSAIDCKSNDGEEVVDESKAIDIIFNDHLERLFAALQLKKLQIQPNTARLIRHWFIALQRAPLKERFARNALILMLVRLILDDNVHVLPFVNLENCKKNLNVVVCGEDFQKLVQEMRKVHDPTYQEPPVVNKTKDEGVVDADNKIENNNKTDKTDTVEKVEAKIEAKDGEPPKKSSE